MIQNYQKCNKYIEIYVCYIRIVHYIYQKVN